MVIMQRMKVLLGLFLCLSLPAQLPTAEIRKPPVRKQPAAPQPAAPQPAAPQPATPQPAAPKASAPAVVPVAPPPVPGATLNAQKQWEVDMDLGGALMKMVLVTPGRFTTDAPAPGEDPKAPRVPHLVSLTTPFWIGKYEVTQAQWQAVTGTNPSSFKGDNLPVESVTWQDVGKFLSKVNRSAGGYRLPTEDEWEYACRGGNQPEGPPPSLDTVAWFGKNGNGTTHKVGLKEPNALGLHDMLGNVWEWCQSSASRVPREGDPGNVLQALSGGSWINNEPYCRPGSRFNAPGEDAFSYLGLRLVRVQP